MPNTVNSIKFISGGLALVYFLAFLYAGSLLSVWSNSRLVQFQYHGWILITLFLILFIGAAGAMGLKEWARKILVAGNAVLLVYLFGFYFFKSDIFPMGYVFLSLIGILFFSQIKTKLAFFEKDGAMRKSVLIVDDDEGLLKTVKPVLLASGYSVLTATTGEKGIQIAKRQKPDLIVLDVILPGMKGRQVCQKLKEDGATHTIPVIFLTAKDSPDDVKAELAAGAISHITKPFTNQKLIDEIKKALGS